MTEGTKSFHRYFRRMQIPFQSAQFCHMSEISIKYLMVGNFAMELTERQNS